MSEAKRAAAYGALVTVALAICLVLVDRTAFLVINRMEQVVEPCQHSGTWDPLAERCACLGPWTGTYCGVSTCQHGGVADTLHVQVPFAGTLWGCRCPDLFIGSLCEQCNANLTADGRCVAPCQPGFFGADCDRFCSPDATLEQVLLEDAFEVELQTLDYGGSLSLCSGHGVCNAGDCDCEPLYFPSEDGRSSCARTCPFFEEQRCAGHGRCDFREDANVVACVCDDGWLGADCSVPCPGVTVDWIGQACAGRGTCALALAGDVALCQCGALFRGEACQYACPTGVLSSSSEPCSGRGECVLKDTPYTRAECECRAPFQGPGCGCDAASTCSGHGECTEAGFCNCRGNFQGTRCNRCFKGFYGTQCDKPCSSHPQAGSDARHCHGRGVCGVVNLGLANEDTICAACIPGYATDTECRNCTEYQYPKLWALQALFDQQTADGAPNPLLEDLTQDTLHTQACHTFANRATCNHAGDPNPLYGLYGDTTSPPCTCDAPNADPMQFCTQCLPTFYPSDMQSADACTRRCVDDATAGAAVSGVVGGVLTLRCVNDGTCSADGNRCQCKDGYSGVDCGNSCAGVDASGVQCSGHGTCVAHRLQGFLESVLGQREATNFTRCECDPGDTLSEAEKLRIFRDEEGALSGDGAVPERDFYGDTCQHSCLPSPWRDGLECSGERCRVLPVANDRGDPILTCVQDSDCGAYVDGRLQFEGKTELSTAEQVLVNTLSAEQRWSPTMGPFCHVKNTPAAVATPNMQCRQRTTKDGLDAATDAMCQTFDNKYDCLHRGGDGGACHYVDVCADALDAFDTWNYCYELMRTEEPEVLRSAECARTCDYDALQAVDWRQSCLDFRSHIPDQFAACGRDLDDLCALKDLDVARCDATLPSDPAAVPDLDAADTSAYCWEVSGQTGAAAYPFAFTPLLDTPAARHKQSLFDTALLGLGSRHPCLHDVAVTQTQCAAMPAVDTSAAPVLFRCSAIADDGSPDVETLSATRVSGQACEALPTLRDLNPFVLRCPDADEDVPVQDLSAAEAVALALEDGCALLPASALAASAVRVDLPTALDTCRRVLDDEDPTPCVAVCGDDACVDLGTRDTNGKRVFECQPRDSRAFVSVDVDTGQCGRCGLGQCSITGRNGGAEYRCVLNQVQQAALRADGDPASFVSCRDGLLLHVDALGSGADAPGVQGTYPVTGGAEDDDDDDARAVAYRGANYTGPLRVEFDATLTAAQRGKVTVEGEFGPLLSVLFFHNGGFGVDLNLPAEGMDACPAGDADRCHLTVEVGRRYRVVVVSGQNEQGDATLTMTVGGTTTTRLAPAGAGAVRGVRVSGTARVRDLWLFRDPDARCARLHRALGRSVSFAASAQPVGAAGAVGGAPSMAFCADAEAAFLPALQAQCGDEESASIVREAAFAPAWQPYCDYTAAHLPALSPAAGGCGGVQAARSTVVACQSVLAHFDGVACAHDASAYDWGAFCTTLAETRVPAALSGSANCSDACVAMVAAADTGQFCDDRDPYWDRDSGDPVPSFLPSECNAPGSQAAWAAYDWSGHCTKLAENKLEGYCSAAVCACREQGGWMGGDACELSCPLGQDYSVCSEDSFGGSCSYPPSMKAAADAFYADPQANKISNQQLFEIEGVCQCRHRDAMSEEGCKVECSANGAEECNPREYVSDGEAFQASTCDPGGSGVCRCNTPLTKQTLVNLTSWKGDRAEVLQFQFGDWSATGAYRDSTAFRVAAQQGQKRLMTGFFGVSEAVYDIQGAGDFVQNPQKYMCEADRACDFHDVMIAQGLFGSSSFFGATCSRACPGVDTGEDMVSLTPQCSGEASARVGLDRLSLAGCRTECLQDHRCNFLEHVNATSVCRLYADCAPSGAAYDDSVVWEQRVQARAPELTPCSGRGTCGITGQCLCDFARELSLTHPLTGEKHILNTTARSALQGVPITTLDTTAFRGTQCEKICPGYDPDGRQSMAEVCSGHGVCDRDANCQCDVNWVG